MTIIRDQRTGIIDCGHKTKNGANHENSSQGAASLLSLANGKAEVGENKNCGKSSTLGARYLSRAPPSHHTTKESRMSLNKNPAIVEETDQDIMAWLDETSEDDGIDEAEGLDWLNGDGTENQTEEPSTSSTSQR